MARVKQVVDELEALVKANDHTSIDCIMKWQYSKDPIFKYRNSEGLHIIHIACLQGCLECLIILIEHGADIHQRSSVGWTALHAATLGGNKEMVFFLVRNCCADVWGQDDMGCIPAALTEDEEILELLEERMEEVQTKQNIEVSNSEQRNETGRKFSLPTPVVSRTEESGLSSRKPRTQSLTAIGPAEKDMSSLSNIVTAKSAIIRTASVLPASRLRHNFNVDQREHFGSDPDIYRDGRLSVADEIPEEEEYRKSDMVARSASDVEASSTKYKARHLPRATFRKFFNRIAQKESLSAVEIDSAGQYSAFLVKSPPSANVQAVAEQQPATLAPPVTRSPSKPKSESRNRDSGVFEEELESELSQLPHQRATLTPAATLTDVTDSAIAKDGQLGCVREGDLLANHDSDQNMKVYFYDLL